MSSERLPATCNSHLYINLEIQTATLQLRVGLKDTISAFHRTKGTVKIVSETAEVLCL